MKIIHWPRVGRGQKWWNRLNYSGSFKCHWNASIHGNSTWNDTKLYRRPMPHDTLDIRTSFWPEFFWDSISFFFISSIRTVTTIDTVDTLSEAISSGGMYLFKQFRKPRLIEIISPTSISSSLFFLYSQKISNYLFDQKQAFWLMTFKRDFQAFFVFVFVNNWNSVNENNSTDSIYTSVRLPTSVDFWLILLKSCHHL